MKIFVAGATGVIGKPLVKQLVAAGHEVTGSTRTDSKAGMIAAFGATPAVCDALDAGSVLEAVTAAAPEVLINQLTALPKDYNPKDPDFYTQNNRIRSEGGHNLVEAAKAAGVSRFITQSLSFMYRQEGTWRGKRRVVAIDYTPAGMPQLRAIEPPNDGEREAVPAALQQATMDGLSALAKLVRSVARTGRCDTAAAVFDGRRRSNYSVRTVSQDILPASGGYAGPALRCAFESRILAGFLLSQDREAEAKIPHPATAWLGEPWPGAGPVPVLIELPTRWFGAVRAVLVSVGPDGSGRSVAQGSTGQQGR